MPNLTRRKILSLSLLPSAIGLFSISACSNDTLKEKITTILAAFLETNFITPSMQCGTRFGDGVPTYSDVEEFISFINTTDTNNINNLINILSYSREQDLIKDNVMIIDGWTYSKTEVLVSAAYIVLTNTNCNLIN